MGMFTKISENAFKELGLNAGMLLNTFNPDSPKAPTASEIICATTGGIKPSCVPNYVDDAEDVDNAPNGTAEGKRLTRWDCKLSFTALTVTAESFAMALGAASVNGDKITPDAPGLVDASRFKDVWWVGDRSDGGFAAIKLSKALSTGGLAVTTTKDGKAQLDVELAGHYSIANQDVAPMEFYVHDAA